MSLTESSLKMKINIEIDVTPDEAKELFVPGDKQNEFMVNTYDAYCKALREMVWDQVDPYNMMNRKDKNV